MRYMSKVLSQASQVDPIRRSSLERLHNSSGAVDDAENAGGNAAEHARNTAAGVDAAEHVGNAAGGGDPWWVGLVLPKMMLQLIIFQNN